MIPAEAVEAAARATRDVCEAYDPGGWAAEEKFTEWARIIIEAAAPHMLAAAWDEGVTVGLGWDENRGEDFSTPNPYKSTPGDE